MEVFSSLQAKAPPPSCHLAAPGAPTSNEALLFATYLNLEIRFANILQSVNPTIHNMLVISKHQNDPKKGLHEHSPLHLNFWCVWDGKSRSTGFCARGRQGGKAVVFVS